jgi:thymidylate synthase
MSGWRSIAIFNIKQRIMTNSQVLIEETNLSIAWKKALIHIVQGSGMEASPLLLTLRKFEESETIRQAVDGHLRNNKASSIQSVSETIFPESLYQYLKRNKAKLYQEYLSNMPRMRKVDPRNANGTYFERLIAFDGEINQLDVIINSLQEKKVKRRSKLQASIFDPRQDHTNKAYQGFPCLQHVTVFQSESGGLVLNSFYAIQYLYKKAYGNWLGLINLGNFLARESGLKLEQVNCYIGVEQLDTIGKAEAKKLLAIIGD